MTRHRKCRVSRKDHLNCPGLEVELTTCNNKTCPLSKKIPLKEIWRELNLTNFTEFRKI